MLRTVISSIMRRRRGLISAIWKLLSEGWDQHPHPLRQETCHATKPLTPRQRLRSILGFPTRCSLTAGQGVRVDKHPDFALVIPLAPNFSLAKPITNRVGGNL